MVLLLEFDVEEGGFDGPSVDNFWCSLKLLLGLKVGKTPPDSVRFGRGFFALGSSITILESLLIKSRLRNSPVTFVLRGLVASALGPMSTSLTLQVLVADLSLELLEDDDALLAESMDELCELRLLECLTSSTFLLKMALFFSPPMGRLIEPGPTQI